MLNHQLNELVKITRKLTEASKSVDDSKLFQIVIIDNHPRVELAYLVQEVVKGSIKKDSPYNLGRKMLVSRHLSTIKNHLWVSEEMIQRGN